MVFVFLCLFVCTCAVQKYSFDQREKKKGADNFEPRTTISMDAKENPRHENGGPRIVVAPFNRGDGVSLLRHPLVYAASESKQLAWSHR